MFGYKMRIYKILNNNAVVSKDKNGKEIIVVGNGIGFRHHVKDEIDTSKILKTYVLSGNSQKNKLITLLEEIPFDCIELTEHIITYAEEVLQTTLNTNLVIVLADHIHCAVERFNQGLFIPNMLNEEIKRYYKKEWNIGLDAVKMINKHFSVQVEMTEAASIAFHIINAQWTEMFDSTIRVVEGLDDILKIIEDYFNVTFEEDTIDYSRLIIHLKFFMKKVYAIHNDHNDDELMNDDKVFKVLKQGYPEVNPCLDKIAEYLKEKHHYEMQDNDRMYLMIHIIRITNK